MPHDKSNPSDLGGVDTDRTCAWISGGRDLVRRLDSSVGEQALVLELLATSEVATPRW